MTKKRKQQSKSPSKPSDAQPRRPTRKQARKAQTGRSFTPSAYTPRQWTIFGLLAVGVLALLFSVRFESFTSLYDADYVGSESCGDCHTVIYDRWQQSPHAKMARPAGPDTVVGDFDNATWTLPADAQVLPDDDEPAARMYREGDTYYMALRDPNSDEFVPFPIAYTIGFQYRQTYLTQEAGGVLRRLPLQWSVERQEYFPYWNFQENSTPSVADLWAQMTSVNSAGNLFCARCHTTHLEIYAKDPGHTFAETGWVDDGIACEACHGPGGHHVNYYEHNYVNRVVAFVNGRIRNQPTAYIANPPKLTKGQDLSTCARCHGPDIGMLTTEVYRVYEPGYSKEGRINDISQFFQQFPLEPGRTAPTVEVWEDGTPKGIGMLFRSFIESACYAAAEVRCYDCHDAHNNKLPTEPGILQASDVSNGYCLQCHSNLMGQQANAEHTNHEPGTEGSFCYDCHMPRRIQNIVTGVQHWTRTHTMSYVPQPERTAELGPEGSPNACNDCHTDQTPQWAAEWMMEWYGGE